MGNHYFSPRESEIKEIRKIVIRVRGVELELYSSSEVFSKDKLDEGTKLLIESAIFFPGWKILDLGCGYGVVGIVLKKLCPSCKVFMVDINPKAVKLSEMNCKLNGADCKVFYGDLFEPFENEKFDLIITNPPYSAGKEIVERFIKESREHLTNRGIFEIVIPKNFLKIYRRILEENYRVCIKINEDRRYAVYICKV